MELFFITDSKLTQKDIFSDVKAALESGIKMIQYREKCKSSRVMLEEILVIKKMTAQYGAKLIINDRIDLALASDADGVHLGQDDLTVDFARSVLGAEKIVGLSTHNLEQVKESVNLAVDYIGFGPIFMTSTKVNAGESCGCALLGEACKISSVPVVAIGGINSINVSEVKEANPSYVAIISDIVCAASVSTQIDRIKKIIEK